MDGRLDDLRLVRLFHQYFTIMSGRLEVDNDFVQWKPVYNYNRNDFQLQGNQTRDR